MTSSLYLINPRNDFPVYYGADVFTTLGLDPAIYIADLVGPTIAALAPDGFEVRLCDEFTSPVDFDTDADYVGITGKSGQVRRMIELAREFRRRGKVVIIGGPYASLVPENMRPHCDVLVRGEIEGIAGRFFDDLGAGTWQPEYVGDRADLSLSPVPRWDLYRNEKALIGTLQTSRGCPFECEFCDVIQYVGRKQRHKPVEQVVAELDALYREGYRQIFLADDNLTVYRRRSKALLAAIRDWNRRQADGQVRFYTQVSIDTARDDELLRLCAEAGLFTVFVGIETPNEESLRETKKRQNVGIDLVGQIQRFLDHGIVVNAGMIVGFDADDETIFERQLDFAMRTPIPQYSLGALMAPEATPLYDRLRRDGRLAAQPADDAAPATPWSTNIVPAQLTAAQLLEGIRWLGNRLYNPAAFEQRVLRFLECFRPPEVPSAWPKAAREVEKDALKVVRNLPRLGPEERAMFASVTSAGGTHPIVQIHLINMLFSYSQARYMYQQGRMWEPHLAHEPAPTFTEPA